MYRSVANRGIFRSIDAGASWMRINDDQHQYGLTDWVITGDPRVFGRVYFGTNGRGIIRGDITGTPTPTPTPNFSLAASPATLTVNRGASGTGAITITRSGGFTGGIALGASGLPGGVTASFTPASTTGNSNLVTFTAPPPLIDRVFCAIWFQNGQAALARPPRKSGA
jgi:xyloglucan-specific exo-beta-1,4-glucanase